MVYNFGHVCISVCLSVCTYVFRTITSESLDIESSFAHVVYLHGLRVDFIYEGHRFKVKVTGAKKVENSIRTIDVKLPSAITPILFIEL